MTRSPRYVLPTHLCRFAVRAGTLLPRGFSGDRGSTASLNRFVRGRPLARTGFPWSAGAIPITGTSRTRPAYPDPSPRRSIAARLRCRNVCLLRFGYACRPRLSPRLTLGGLASPRKPRVYGGRVTLPSLATHASILARMRSTARFPGRFAPHPTHILCHSARIWGP